MNNFWNFEPRRPRHQATNSPAPVLIRTEGAGVCDWQVGELADISRNGVRLRRAPCLEVGTRIEVTIPFIEQWLNTAGSATVRWSQQDGEGTATIACEYDTPIAWELLGELILAGALRIHDPNNDESNAPNPQQSPDPTPAPVETDALGASSGAAAEPSH